MSESEGAVADGQRRTKDAGSAGGEVVTGLSGADLEQDGQQNHEDDVQSRDIGEAPLQSHAAVALDHDQCHKANQSNDPLPGHGNLLADGSRGVLIPILLIAVALGGVLAGTVGIPDQEDQTDGEEDHQHDKAIPHAGEDGQTHDLLRDAGGEHIEHAAGKAAAGAQQHRSSGHSLPT